MTAKIHRVHFPGVGEGIVQSGGGEPYQTDDVQQYDLGAYVRFGNKGFVYGLSAGIAITQQGASSGSSVPQPVQWTTIAATVEAGAKQVTVDLPVLQGPASDGNIAKDALVGGEICLMPTWGTGFTRHITGNSAVVGDSGGEFTVDFDTPINAKLTVDASWAECTVSPYKDLKTGVSASAYSPIVGMPTCLAVDGKYLWLQVEGPFGIAAQTDVGATGHDMQAVFRRDGTIGPHIDDEAEQEMAQHAGVIMFMAYAVAGGFKQGLPFCNLQIAH